MNNEENIENRIKIEVPVSEDARAIQEVYYRSWLVTYPNKEYGITVKDIEDSYKDAFTEETIKARADRIAHPLDNVKMLVARDGEKVVGVCRIVLYFDKNQLQTMYLLPEYQGKGIGTMLWNGAVKFFDKNKDTVLGVAVYNKRAIAFYEKLGFKDTGKRYSQERLRLPSGADIPEMEMVIKAGQLVQ